MTEIRCVCGKVTGLDVQVVPLEPNPEIGMGPASARELRAWLDCDPATELDPDAMGLRLEAAGLVDPYGWATTQLGKAALNELRKRDADAAKALARATDNLLACAVLPQFDDDTRGPQP